MAALLGTVMNSASLALVFGDRVRELPVTAIKCSIGEALGASGPAQIAIAIEALNNQVLPGIVGLQELPPGCPLQGISGETREIKARIALVNGVGLDGNCCSIVIAVSEC